MWFDNRYNMEEIKKREQCPFTCLNNIQYANWKLLKVLFTWCNCFDAFRDGSKFEVYMSTKLYICMYVCIVEKNHTGKPYLPK
jgi:hypothetical protein